jgi:DNA-binding transcriptional LysR family regulator
MSPCISHVYAALRRDTRRENKKGKQESNPISQEFLEAARRIVEETAAITARLRTRSRGESARLTIGVHASLSAGNLRATLVDYRHRFPDVETQFVDGSSEHLISDVANSAIDVAFVAENHPERDAKSLSVWSERVVVALPEDHPLASHDIVRWSELRNEALLLPQRGPGQNS